MTVKYLLLFPAHQRLVFYSVGETDRIRPSGWIIAMDYSNYKNYAWFDTKIEGRVRTSKDLISLFLDFRKGSWRLHWLINYGRC